MSPKQEMRVAGRVGNIAPLLHDAFMGGLSLWAALYLRLSERMFRIPDEYLYWGTLGFAGILTACLFYERSNRRLWRYVSLSDLMSIARAGMLAILVFYVVLFQFTRLEGFPRSAVAIHAMTLMVFLMGPRVLWRLTQDRTLIEKLKGRGQIRTLVLLVGAGREAELFIRESVANPNFPYRVVGLVDDDARNHGRELHHARIYGRIDETGFIIDKLARKNRKPQRLILTEPGIEKTHGDALLKVAEEKRVSLARMPRISALGDGAAELATVAVEDILGRAQQQLDREAMRALVAGKRVMVTGAGGSIGSELVRQVAAFGPQSLVLYELSEFNLYSIDYAIVDAHPEIAHVPVVGDIRDEAQLAAVMRAHRPEIVFHAAAVKHVPMCEVNTDQAVLTNVLGTKAVADACVAHQVPLMVQVSTDKAVNPLSVMGATKRVAEMYAQALGNAQATTRFATVRFGNVLNSAGSVVPLFERQIRKGGPVTITHPEMMRYFMTIAEAVELVLQAASLATEAGSHIYVLEMGEPVKIEELARQMIRLAGLKPGEDIVFSYTGLRAGEKLYEELFHAGEALEGTAHPSIRHAKARGVEMGALKAQIEALAEHARMRDEAAVRKQLKRMVPEAEFSYSGPSASSREIL